MTEPPAHRRAEEPPVPAVRTVTPASESPPKPADEPAPARPRPSPKET